MKQSVYNMDSILLRLFGGDVKSTGARSSLLTVVDRRAKNTENTESQEKVPTLAQTNAEKLTEPL